MGQIPVNPPRWAETTVGVPAVNITVPSSGQLDTGFTVSEVPPSSFQNWWQWVIYKYTQFFQTQSVQGAINAVAGPMTQIGNVAALAPTPAFGMNHYLISTNYFSTQGSGIARLLLIGGTGTNSGKVYLSDDGGVSWTLTNPANATAWFSIAWNGTVACVVGAAGAISTGVMTAASITWTTQTSGVANNNTDVCWCPGMTTPVFVIAQQNSANVLTSPTGVTWTAHATGLTTSASAVPTLAWSTVSNTVCMAGGCTTATTTTAIATSVDGTTWTAQTVPTAAEALAYGLVFADFANSPQRGTSVFLYWDKAGDIMTSPTGVTWTKAGSVPNVGNNPGQWFWTGSAVVGWFPPTSSQPAIVVSVDGITFTPKPGPLLVTWNGSGARAGNADSRVPYGCAVLNQTIPIPAGVNPQCVFMTLNTAGVDTAIFLGPSSSTS